MKNLIGIIIIILVIGLGYNGYQFAKKYRHSKRLKFGVGKIRFPKLNLSSLLTEIPLYIELEITNFSPTTFEINQISVDVHDENDTLVAEQKNPLTETLPIHSNKKTSLPLSYAISPQQLTRLIQHSGGIAKVGANFITTGSYNIPIKLKGFIVTEGIALDINETITI